MKLGSFVAVAWLGIASILGASACGSEAGAPASEPPGSPDAPTKSAQAPTDPAKPSPPSEGPAPNIPKLGAPYPIVLLHGAAGFGSVGNGPIEVTYFNGVKEDLEQHGEAEVYVTVAPPYAPSETRAKIIAQQIDDILYRTRRAKVNIIGHSQGGLDARVLASPNGLGYGDRIASITTVSTPHRGTRLADATLGYTGWLPKAAVDAATGAFLGFLQKSVYDIKSDPEFRAQVEQMTETNMRDVFNPKYIDAPGVVYRSYAGRTNMRFGTSECKGSTYPNPDGIDVTQPTFAASAVFLEEGFSFKVNDGIVTVDSAKWGQFEQCVPADHLKEVGHIGVLATFDQKQLFRDIVTRVRQIGL